MSHPYRVLDHKRSGESLSASEIREIVAGAVDGSWSDAQLAAFLMAAAIRGLDASETDALTRAMLASGARWDLRADFPGLVDKHSTGGVGDKVSLVLSPLLAACDIPVAMLTGRGLGHTGGTADKLETIPALDLSLDRRRCCRVLEACGMAIGVATEEIAPADRKLYALRDQTGTVVSIPLITASILSKKLATGAESIVFDVKTGSGAFLTAPARARELAAMLVRTALSLGCRSSALITDMGQPLGNWAGNSCEVGETVQCLEGDGPQDLMAVVYALAEEASRQVGRPLERGRLDAAIASGAARERFALWVESQGGRASALTRSPELAPICIEARAASDGFLSAVDARGLGLALSRAGGGRVTPDDVIDPSVALERCVRVGEPVERGRALARLFVRRPDESLRRELERCFTVGEVEPPVPQLIQARLGEESAAEETPPG